MFSSDRFHPSPAGYARAAAALLPSVCAALGIWVGEGEAEPDRRRGEGVEPVAVAAVQAVRDPGTEVSPTAAAGQARGPRGLLAILRRRPPEPLTDRGELVDATALERSPTSDGGEHPGDHPGSAGSGPAPAGPRPVPPSAGVDDGRDPSHTRQDRTPQ
jgi:hypothetical protein